MSKYVNHEIQIMLVIIVLALMAICIIKTIKKNGIKSDITFSMFVGFCIGSIMGFYVLNSFICAFIGMFLGVRFGGKQIKKND